MGLPSLAWEVESVVVWLPVLALPRAGVDVGSCLTALCLKFPTWKTTRRAVGREHQTRSVKHWEGGLTQSRCSWRVPGHGLLTGPFLLDSCHFQFLSV